MKKFIKEFMYSVDGFMFGISWLTFGLVLSYLDGTLPQTLLALSVVGMGMAIIMAFYTRKNNERNKND